MPGGAVGAATVFAPHTHVLPSTVPPESPHSCFSPSVGGRGEGVLAKLGVLLGLGRLFRMSRQQNALFAFALAQRGEFGFVLVSFAAGQGVLRHLGVAQA